MVSATRLRRRRDEQLRERSDACDHDRHRHETSMIENPADRTCEAAVATRGQVVAGLSTQWINAMRTALAGAAPACRSNCPLVSGPVGGCTRRDRRACQTAQPGRGQDC